MSNSGAITFDAPAVPILPAPSYLYGSGIVTTTPAIQGLMTMMPIEIPRPVRVDRLLAEVTAVGGGDTLFRIGLYDVDPATRLPRNLLFDSGDVPADTVATKQVVCDIAITQPLVYTAFVVSNVAGSPATFRIVTSGRAQLPSLAPAGASVYASLYASLAPGAALPATPALGSVATTTYAGRVGVRIA